MSTNFITNNKLYNLDATDQFLEKHKPPKFSQQERGLYLLETCNQQCVTFQTEGKKHESAHW